MAVATFRAFLHERLRRAFTLANQLGWTAQYPTSLSPYGILKKGSHPLVLYQQAKVALKERTGAARVNSQSLLSMYWAVKWSWFAQVNALCNLSCKKSQQVSVSLQGQFLSRRCFTLCKNYQAKGMEDEKKVSLHCFSADQDIANLWKKCVFGHHITQTTGYSLLPDTFWLQASKNANSLSPTFHCKESKR